jgi:hypothetical protein
MTQENAEEYQQRKHAHKYQHAGDSSETENILFNVIPIQVVFTKKEISIARKQAGKVRK